MRKENKNWTLLNKSILRFGNLSQYQRKVEGIDIKPNEAYLKCEDYDVQFETVKHSSGWDLGSWKVCLRKAQVLKDKTGYFIQTRVELYCSNCAKSDNT